MISLQLLWCGRRLQSGRLCPSRFLLILEKITHPALFSTTLSLKLKTNDSVAIATFCAIVYNYVTHYWGEGSCQNLKGDYFAHAHEIPTFPRVCDIWKMKSVLLLVLFFALVAAQEPERCGTYGNLSMNVPIKNNNDIQMQNLHLHGMLASQG